MEKYYSIHNILTFKVISKAYLANRLIGNWDIELQGFESNNVDNLDFVISIDKFTPDISNCTIIDDDYYIKENYLYCKDSYKYASWELEMSGFEKGEMEVRIHSNFLGMMLIPELIINHLIWFKLNEKGYPIVHGSCVSKNNQSYIFAGQGASGKSTIASSLVEKGFQLLSDHFICLNKDTVWSFPTPFHILDFNLSSIIGHNMSFKHKVSFHFKQLLKYKALKVLLFAPHRFTS